MDPAKPWAALPPTGPLLRPAEAAAYLGYSVSQYYALAAKGVLPAAIRIGPGHNGAAGVPRPWLDATIAARAVGPLA